MLLRQVNLFCRKARCLFCLSLSYHVDNKLWLLLSSTTYFSLPVDDVDHKAAELFCSEAAVCLSVLVPHAFDHEDRNVAT